MRNIRTNVFEESRKLRRQLEHEKRLRAMWRRKYYELDKRFKKLEKELRKFKNENTPSSAIPVYLKPIMKSPNRLPVGTNPRGKPKGSNGATKPPPTKIDETLEATANCCPKGHNHIKLLEFLVNIFFEINKIEMRVIEGKQGVYRCQDCGEVFCAVHPSIPQEGMIGPNLQAFIIELKHNFAGSYEKISNFLEDLTGNTFSPQGLKDSIYRTGKQLEHSYREIERELRNSKSIGIDETGWRMNGENWYLWLFRAINIVFITIQKSRARMILTKILGTDFEGCVTSDCFRIYRGFARYFQKCWSHLLRYTHSLAEQYKNEDITRLHRSLDNLFNEMSNFLKKKPPPKIRRKRYEIFNRKLREIMNIKWKSQQAKDVVKNWLKEYEGHWLTAIRFVGVELTNNKTERDLRKVIPTRKLLGCHRTEEGTKYFAIIETHRQTWKVMGESPYLKMAEHLRSLNANSSPVGAL